MNFWLGLGLVATGCVLLLAFVGCASRPPEYEAAMASYDRATRMGLNAPSRYGAERPPAFSREWRRALP